MPTEYLKSLMPECERLAQLQLKHELHREYCRPTPEHYRVRIQTLGFVIQRAIEDWFNDEATDPIAPATHTNIRTRAEIYAEATPEDRAFLDLLDQATRSQVDLIKLIESRKPEPLPESQQWFFEGLEKYKRTLQ